MPEVLNVLDRFPVPSLKNYVAFSALLLATVFFQAWHVVTKEEGLWSSELEARLVHSAFSNETIELINGSALMRMAFYALNDQLTVWVFINWVCCIAALLGHALVWTVFGKLRGAEQLAVRERFWNFVFYKFVLVFGVLNVEFLDEAVCWCLWLTGIGLVFILTTLAQDRLKQMWSSSGGGTGASGRERVGPAMAFLGGATMLSFCGLGFSLLAASHYGLNYALFLTADALQMCMRSLYCFVGYGLEVKRRLSPEESEDPEGRAHFRYYTELAFDMALLGLDFLHHLHMLCWSNICLSMACLVIGLQLRHIWQEMDRRLRKHRNFLRILHHIQNNFPLVHVESTEVEPCPICWEQLKGCRELPCKHRFHQWCLRGWLDQDPSCPTCRAPLALLQPPPPPPAQAQPVNRGRQVRWTFNGSRFARWLPSFSVEFSHDIGPILRPTLPPVSTSQLNTMAEQILEMFPQAGRERVLADLEQTQSLDLTIENILEGRLDQLNLNPGPENAAFPNDDPTTSNDEQEIHSSEGEQEEGEASPAWESSSWESEGDSAEEPAEETPRTADEEEESVPFVAASISTNVRQQRAALVSLHRRKYLTSRNLSEEDVMKAIVQ